MNSSKIFFFFFLFLVLSSSVAAIGAVKIPTEFPFEENERLTVSYTIVNPASFLTTIELSAEEGSVFADYLTFSENNILMAPGSVYSLEASIDFPDYDSLTEFGLQETWIYAVEASPPAGSGGGMFTIKTAVRTAIKVYIPFPGQFAEIISLEVPHVLSGEQVYLSATVKNRGTEPLANKALKITIYDKDKKSMDNFRFSGISLEPDQAENINQLVKKFRF